MQKDKLSMNTNGVERRFDLDWLRVFAFGLLIFYHTGRIFAGWMITNSQPSHLLTLGTFALSQWRLPLLSIVSGAGVFYALKKYSPQYFLRDRVIRLFIPLVFGCLFIVPPQLYFHRLSVGEVVGSYLSFQAGVFSLKIYPAGNLHWAHLWYIAYILIYTFAMLPFFLFLKSGKAQKFLHGVSKIAKQKELLLLLTLIPLIAVDVFTVLYINPKGSKFLLLLVYFIYGYTLFTNTGFISVAQKWVKWMLPLGCVTTSLILTVGDPGRLGDVYIQGGLLQMVLGKVLKNVNTLLWVLSLAGLAKTYFNRNNATLKYATEAVYPFYILHQTVIVIIAYFVVQWDTSIAAKFWFISVSTIFCTLGIFHFIVRRFKLSRFLFGLKTKKGKSQFVSQPHSNTEMISLINTGQKIEAI
jgi:glucan biosynthesis protein C